jgi:pimeloyl-ACP methyl ester carboxylesterase
MNKYFEPTVRTLQTHDGTRINYLALGHGPGLVLVPGSMGSATDYMPLAQDLAETYTVYIVDRRGHGQSGPIKDHHSIDIERQDVQLVVEQTKSRFLFGHSIGGLISLEVALAMTLEKLAVYEPPISVQGSIPRDWLPAMEQALGRKQYAKAMTIIMKGLQLSSDANKLPTPLLQALMSVMMRLRKTADGKPWGEHIKQLLPTMPTDIGLVYELDSAYEKFATLTTSTLLLGGDKSAKHFKLAIEVLGKTLPNAQTKRMPGLEHNAPNTDAPDKIARELKNFFTKKP